MINMIIEDGYGESSLYLDQIKEDYASSSEDNISFRGDNLDDILIERIEEIEDIVENYNDHRGLIVFIYELFNSFYGYSKQAIVDSSVLFSIIILQLRLKSTIHMGKHIMIITSIIHYLIKI